MGGYFQKLPILSRESRMSAAENNSMPMQSMKNKNAAREGNAATNAVGGTKNETKCTARVEPILSGYSGLDGALRAVDRWTAAGLPWLKNPDALREVLRTVAADMDADAELLRVEAQETISPAARLAFKLAEKIARDHAARYRCALGIGPAKEPATR